MFLNIILLCLILSHAFQIDTTSSNQALEVTSSQDNIKSVQKSLETPNQSSPTCWLLGLETIFSILDTNAVNLIVSNGSGEKFCAILNDSQKNIIAFEVARCFHENYGSPFWGESVSPLDVFSCSFGNIQSSVQLQKCSGFLSMNAYLEYRLNYKHFNDVCLSHGSTLLLLRKYGELIEELKDDDHTTLPNLIEMKHIQSHLTISKNEIEASTGPDKIMEPKRETQKIDGMSYSDVIFKLFHMSRYEFDALWATFRFTFLLTGTFLFTAISRHTRTTRYCILGLVLVAGTLNLFVIHLYEVKHLSNEEKTALLNMIRSYDVFLCTLVYCLGSCFSMFTSGTQENISSINHEPCMSKANEESMIERIPLISHTDNHRSKMLDEISRPDHEKNLYEGRDITEKENHSLTRQAIDDMFAKKILHEFLHRKDNNRPGVAEFGQRKREISRVLEYGNVSSSIIPRNTTPHDRSEMKTNSTLNSMIGNYHEGGIFPTVFTNEATFDQNELSEDEFFSSKEVLGKESIDLSHKLQETYPKYDNGMNQKEPKHQHHVKDAYHSPKKRSSDFGDKHITSPKKRKVS